MTALINKIGRKISGFLGDQNACFSETSFSDHFRLDAFCETIPYRSYDEENGIYFLENSLGFVLELVPTIGSEKTLIDELSGIFEKVLKEESSLQFLLIADHRIADYLISWEEEKQGSEVLKKLAERRCSYYCANKNLKFFRIIVSYSEHLNHNQVKEVAEKKKMIKKALSNRLCVKDLKPKEFLSSVRFLVDFRSSKKKEERDWCPLTCLSKQIFSGGS